MAYNKTNYYKRIAAIVSVYNAYKNEGVADTTIVRTIFPRHNIHISYRTWMYMKGTPLGHQPKKQLAMFN